MIPIPKLSIIHPSRGRPEKSVQTIYRWLSESKVDPYADIEIIISLDKSDPELENYRNVYYKNVSHHVLKCFNSWLVNDNKSVVDAINIGAKESKGDVLIVVSDDTECFNGWGQFLLKYINAAKKDFIIKTNDGVQPWIITNPIMDRTYYNRFGYIYHPDYKHMFCDTELTCVADLTGRKITSNILFKHNHYSVTKEPPDAISKRADGTWDHGEKLFLERYKRNFDLKPEDIKGKIQDNGMINWLKRKAR